MSLTVLRAGIDTLVVSLGGELSESIITRLDSAKASAQELDEPVPFSLGLAEAFMMPSAFGKWRWRIKHPEFALVLKRKAQNGTPVAQIHFSAFGLANTDPKVLWDFVLHSVCELVSFSPLAVSRADIAVDFQGWIPAQEEMKNIVCDASYRGTHGTAKEVETYQFGKKPTLLRLYNKTAEIKHSNKTWMYDLWNTTGTYDPDLPVYRIEIELWRETLALLGINSVNQVLNDPGALLDYGLRWAQLRIPSADKTKTRWPEDERWRKLRTATFGGIPLERNTRVCDLMDLERVKSNLIGLTATACAYYGTGDFIAGLQRLMWAAEVRMMQDGTDFPALVASKRQRIISGA